MRRTRHALGVLLAATLAGGLGWPASARGAEAAPEAQGEPLGRLTIRAEQGTPDGPRIGPCEAEVELRHNGIVMRTMTAHLDESGVGVVEGLPVGAGVIPVVKIRHADVFYLRFGEVMDGANPSQEITVTCYEVTEIEPAWQILMRHIMLVGDPHGIRITEIVQIRSGGDRTWLGASHASSAPITTSFSLPRGASNIQLMQGFNGWEDTTRMGDVLYNHLPLMPGDTEMTLSYMIESHRDEAALAFSAPVLTQHAMLIVPDTIGVSHTANIEPGGATRIADTDVHFYMAQSVPPGAELQITVTALSAAPVARTMGDYAEPSPDTPHGPSTMKWVAAGGGALILLAAGALLAFRRGPASS